MPMSPRLLRPRAAGGFDPRTIAGLEAWWDAADAASVTLDSGRVSQLNDKSGKGRHAANSTSGSTQPDYISAARNGRNAVRFAAASTQRLTVANSTAMFNFVHNGSDAYIAFVASAGDSADPNTFLIFFGNNAASDAVRGFHVRFEDRASLSFNERLFAATSNAGNSVRPYTASTSNGSLPPQVAAVCEVVLDTDNATAGDRGILRVNGGEDVKGNTNTAAPSASNASYNFQIGAGGNNAFPMTGDICEILIYSNHPTAAAQTAIRRYLAAKWGVTLA